MHNCKSPINKKYNIDIVILPGNNTNNVWDTVKHFKSEEVLSATKFRQVITSNSSQEREEDTTPPHPSAKVQYKTVQYSTVKYGEYSTV